MFFGGFHSNITRSEVFFCWVWYPADGWRCF